MADQHSQSFFGQNTGLIISSSSKSDAFLFIRGIRRKSDGNWEKLSAGEGKVIKCSLEEIVMILTVLNRNSLKWQSYHTYKDNKTSISIGWEDEEAKTLWINIDKYSKMINYAQAEIIRLLLIHILDEKIRYATSSNNENMNKGKDLINSPKDINYISHNGKSYYENYKANYKNKKTQITTLEPNNPPFQQENSIISNSSPNANLLNEMSNIDGTISGETHKALLINFNSGKEIWIPKSTIHCQYSPKQNLVQKFLIDNWVLKRNKIIS
ncbi:MAG: hypothetical protein ACFFDK_03215 [Promethearchaeota archaeon]